MTTRYEYQPLFCYISHTSLHEDPKFVALSYAWGDTKDSRMILLENCPVTVTKNLYDAMMTLRPLEGPIHNEAEKEQQVPLMSKIYKQARQVIGWLGNHDNDSNLAFNLFITGFEWRRAADALIETGHMRSMEDLFAPNRRLVQAAALLVQRPWFQRLWIVQEVTLTSTLELHCGYSSIPGDVFFKAIRILSSIVTDPPMPWLLKPYRHALKLGQLRAQVSAGQNYSFPHLAQVLSGWHCSKVHDRLIALFGLVFRDTEAWFTPSYSISGPDFYAEFAKRHIHMTGSLSILHYAGCGDSDAHRLLRAEDRVILQANPPADDIASWVPDWRVRSRPLTLSPNVENGSIGFAATDSVPEFKLNHHILHVRAREMDKIKVYGYPYYESLGRSLKMTEIETFNHWFNLANSFLKDADVESMFSSTLVMDGKVAVTERQDIGVNSTDVPSLFGHWASKHLDDVKRPRGDYWQNGVEESTRYSYIAEEICRNRTFFITEAGRLGLGSVHVSPGAFIYLIHGLKSPFKIHHSHGMHVLRGECYVHGLMDRRIQCSGQDSFLYLK
ncbi:heterokaryon incompatibility protein-domain-containing protein [Paraphoma chrysanthemicola]|uniref:Heterokaryon incompatibility protein-domain-containing protein n=1 Tax=Paraphoma chrysanthemicola TaxID=798071 RepID=A0A8K0VYV8_9PLEO|nr:heterokaryon incompatibility protein-domain-containing protein [Paraphoma chrysanthemicola]